MSSAPTPFVPTSVAQADANTTSRKALREQLLAARQSLGAREALDTQICEKLSAVLHKFAPRCVGFYWPIQGEVDVRPALAAWLAEDRTRCAALPVVIDAQAPLDFHAWQADTPMVVGRYGIPIPAETPRVEPDMLLLPCVGFGQAEDSNWYRLGYGGGFYDRTLAVRRAAGTVPYALGIAHHAAQVASLSPATHDIPLSAVLTEQGLLR